MNKGWILYALAMGLAAGCASQVDEVGSSDQWLCATTADGLVTCGSASETFAGIPGSAYVCVPGDTSVGCPSEAAMADLHAQLDVLTAGIEGADVEGFLTTTPFACLLTGANQRECLMEIVGTDADALIPAMPETPSETPSTPETPEATPGETPEAPSGEVLEGPSTPRDCDPATWERWFAELSMDGQSDRGVNGQSDRAFFRAA